MDLELSSTDKDGVRRVDVRGDLTIYTAAQLKAALIDEAEDHPGDPVYDLNNTDRLAARQRMAGALKRIGAHDHD